MGGFIFLVLIIAFFYYRHKKKAALEKKKPLCQKCSAEVYASCLQRVCTHVASRDESL